MHSLKGAFLWSRSTNYFDYNCEVVEPFQRQNMDQSQGNRCSNASSANNTAGSDKRCGMAFKKF